MGRAGIPPAISAGSACCQVLLSLCLSTQFSSISWGAGSGEVRLVVVLYPQNNDGSPGNFLVNQSIRSTFASEPSQNVEIYNEYLDVSGTWDDPDREIQRDYLRRKYAHRQVDLVIAGLSPALDSH